MSKFGIPGFLAEASIYRRGADYRAATYPGQNTGISPQQARLSRRGRWGVSCGPCEDGSRWCCDWSGCWIEDCHPI
jgi:hypothetical protein